jgi:hypothetical protein
VAAKVLTFLSGHCQRAGQAVLETRGRIFLRTIKCLSYRRLPELRLSCRVLPKFVWWHWECIESTVVKASTDRVKSRKSRLNRCP